MLVVHLDPTHISILPELLQKHTKMPVCAIEDGMQVEPDHVYVIPPNKDLTILHGKLQLTDLVKPRGANLPIDYFFRALAQDQERNAACIILSGTGSDGTLGAKAIKGALGMVMVQDKESAKYKGMPRSAIDTDLFASSHKKWKLFRRKPPAVATHPHWTFPHSLNPTKPATWTFPRQSRGPKN